MPILDAMITWGEVNRNLFAKKIWDGIVLNALGFIDTEDAPKMNLITLFPSPGFHKNEFPPDVSDVNDGTGQQFRSRNGEP